MVGSTKLFYVRNFSVSLESVKFCECVRLSIKKIIVKATVLQGPLVQFSHGSNPNHLIYYKKSANLYTTGVAGWMWLLNISSFDEVFEILTNGLS